jgi:hypothetical protein
MDALGYQVVKYVAGGMLGYGTPDEQGYSSKFRLDILRYALITIDLADRVKDQFKTRSQADEWAVSEIAKMIPCKDPVGKVESGKGKAEARIKQGADFEKLKAEFLKAITAELNRVVDREVAKVSTVEELSEQVEALAGELTTKINEIASEALARGVNALAEMEQESPPSDDPVHVHDFMDVWEAADSGGNSPSDASSDSDNPPSLRTQEILTSMPETETGQRDDRDPLSDRKPPPVAQTEYTPEQRQEAWERLVAEIKKRPIDPAKVAANRGPGSFTSIQTDGMNDEASGIAATVIGEIRGRPTATGDPPVDSITEDEMEAIL